MNDKSKEYVERIRQASRCSDEQILSLEKEVNKYLKTLPNDEADEFADSGYGEALYMLASGIRYQRENKIQ